MNLWPVEHFWLTFFPDQHRVSFFPSDFLQNPYFKQLVYKTSEKESNKIEKAYLLTVP